MNVRALKPVLLMVARYNKDDIADTETTFHPTLADAKARAAEVATMGCDFGIYTLYQRGHIPSIKWDINTEPVANILENTKYEESAKFAAAANAADDTSGKSRANRRWTDSETKLMVEAIEEGWDYDDVAKMLGRTKKAIIVRSTKLCKLGLIKLPAPSKRAKFKDALKAKGEGDE